MSDIQVEAVDSLDPTAGGSAEYVLYGGKGGVGKTTMAAATALASATDGTPTLVVSTDPAHSLSDTLDVDVPAEPGRLRDDVPLYGVEIDPESAMADAAFYGGPGGDGDGTADGPATGGGPLGGLGGPLGDLLGGDESPLTAAGMPGADEAAAMQALLRFMDDERFDRVVVDTAPTGHTLRLLELPEQLDSMVGRLLRFREKMSGMMDGLAGVFGGDDDPDVDQGLGDLDELQDRVERLRAVLTDPARTDFRVVLVPEVMSVRESERLVARLDEFGVPVGTVVVNRVMEPLTDLADVDPDAFASPNVEHCEFCKRRWAVQQEALREAQDLFRGHDVKRVPLLAEAVRGERALRLVAACLS